MITENAQLIKRLPTWLYKFGSQLFIDKKWPRHLFIETTAACNLACGYCPREKVKSHMDWEIFKRIIDEASAYGPRSFSLHLFGEPLLYPHIVEATRYIKKRNRRNTILLTTNGTLLGRFIDDLKEVDKIIWSWRPEAKFSDITKAKLKRHRGFTVRLIKEVVPEEDYKEYARWPNVEVRKLHNYGGNIELKPSNVQSTETRWPCYHLWLAPAVAWNGNFLICCADPHQKEVVGKFPDQTISDLWTKMDGIRNAHLAGKYTGICEKCDVWKTYPDIFYSWQRTGSSSLESS